MLPFVPPPEGRPCDHQILQYTFWEVRPTGAIEQGGFAEASGRSGTARDLSVEMREYPRVPASFPFCVLNLVSAHF